MIIPRTVLLSTTPLPAGGVYLPTAPFDLPVGTDKVTFFVRYTPAVAGGRPIFRLSFFDALQAQAPLIEEARDTVTNSSSIMIATPDASFDFYQSQPRGPADSPPNVDNYVLTCCCLPGGVRGVRLATAEAGPGAPGSVQIVIVGSGP